MRSREPRLVVTFHTTASAMAAEKLCVRNQFPGKLISVPRSITSDCGIAWSAPPELRETLESMFLEHEINAAGFYELTL